MVPKAEKERLKSLVRETLTLLCKNGLPYKSHFSLEALVGITLDKKDVLLVSINEDILGSNEAQPYITCASKSPATPPAKRKRQSRYPRRQTASPPPQESDEEGEDETTVHTEDIGIKMEISHEGDEEEDEDDHDDSSVDSVAGSMPDVSSDEGSGGEQATTGRNSTAVDENDTRESQQNSSRTRLRSRKSESDKGRSGEPRLNPMTLDESAKIWQKAHALRRNQKEPSPKRRGRKRHSEEPATDSNKEPVDDKPDTPPMCHICGKTMSTEKNLTKHVRRHLGMFAVYCDECGKGFFDKTDLDAHAAKHANQKLYQCDICGRSYSHKRGLLKHARKDHPGSEAKIPEDISHVAGTSVQLQTAVESIQKTAGGSEGSSRVSGVQVEGVTVVVSSQAAEHMNTDSNMTAQSVVPASQIVASSTATLPQQIPGSVSIMPHVAHITQSGTNVSLHPGQHPTGESAYYYTYPSQSVFPGGPTH